MTHPTDDSLKPCPFCGGAAALHPRTCDKDTPYNPADRAFPIVRCGQCGAEAVGKNWGRPETAAEKWNTRALLAEQARTEPVGWRYRTNGVHVHFSEVLPPDDAYDPGTLVALYEQPPPLKAEQAKDAAEDAKLLERAFVALDNYRAAIHYAQDKAALMSAIKVADYEAGLVMSAIRAARAAERKAP